MTPNMRSLSNSTRISQFFSRFDKNTTKLDLYSRHGLASYLLDLKERNVNVWKINIDLLAAQNNIGNLNWAPSWFMS